LGEDDQGRAHRTKVALDIANSAAANGKPADYSVAKKLIVKIHRQRLARSKVSVVEMDKWSFKAHFKTVRG